MRNKKQQFWKPGNIIVTRGDFHPEYYIIKDDKLAYPCNKTIDKWWLNLYENDYNDNLKSTRPENVRKYWDVIAVYTLVDAKSNISMWTSDNIAETKGGLFFSFEQEHAISINNDGAFLMKDTYNDDLTCNLKNRASWDFVRVYKKNNNFKK